METRLYFLIGDLLACIVSGAAAAWLVWLAIPAGWAAPVWMPAGMVLGMVIGTPVGVIGGVLFTPLFGAMEISMPAGLSGMAAGMLAGMATPMTEISATGAPGIGAAAGLVCLAYSYIRHAMLVGVVE